MESPRAGRAVSLPSAARRAWVSPDATAAILRTDSSVILFRSPEQWEPVAEVASGIEISVAWDRSSAGFALCWESACESRGANGATRARWELPSGSRLLAFSAESGLLTATAENAEWRRGTEVTRLETLPVAAAFRPGAQEVWLLDADGHLSGQDAQGRRTGDAELLAGALGLVASLDGRALFAANAEGAAAIISMDTLQTELVTLEDTVEGVWAAPGLFAARLHDSGKRTVGIWNGQSGLTGWLPAIDLPAVDGEVR